MLYRSEVLLSVQLLQDFPHSFVCKLCPVIGYHILWNAKLGHDILHEELDCICCCYHGQWFCLDSLGKVAHNYNQKFHLPGSFVEWP